MKDHLKYFSYEHLNNELKPTVELFNKLAQVMINDEEARQAQIISNHPAKRGFGKKPLLVVEDNPQFILGIQKLVEAKDCFVRASL